MPEKAPAPKSPEQSIDQQAEQEKGRESDAFNGVANEIIDRFYEGANELSEEDRAFMADAVSQEILTISREEEGNQEAMKERIKSLIRSLKQEISVEEPAAKEAEAADESTNEKEATADAHRPEGVPTTEEVNRAKELAEEEPVRTNIFKRAWEALANKFTYQMYFGRADRQEKRRARREGETDEEYAKRMDRQRTIYGIGGAALLAAGGAFVVWSRYQGVNIDTDSVDGAGLDTIDSLPGAEGYTGEGVEGADDVRADIDQYGHHLDNAETQANLSDTPINIEGAEGTFEGTMFDGYNPAEDAFNMEGKLGENNWAPPVPTELSEGAHYKVAGLDELIDTSWKTSPEQLSTVAAEMGLDGFSTGNIEEMAEAMKDNPNFAYDSFSQLMDIVNDPDTVIREGKPLQPGTYGSYYETMIDGQGTISFDSVVNEPGSTIEMEYTNRKTGVREIIEFKRECGQIIKRIPSEALPQGGAPAPVVENVPQGGAPAPVVENVPQGGAPTPEQPTPENPVNPEVPTPETPEQPTPENPEKPVIPEKPETPEEPEQPTPDDSKKWEEGVNDPNRGVSGLGEYRDSPAEGTGNEAPDMNAEQQPGDQVADIVAPEATEGTGGTREDLGVGNQGEEAAAADLGQSHESATSDATVEDAGTSDEAPGTEVENPF